MELKLDTSKEYGLVLEGGGAKGAYQIGAWRALRENGVKITGVSGTSVGALNGGMICMDDVDHAYEIWENISYSKIMDVDEDVYKRQVHGGAGTCLSNIPYVQRLYFVTDLDTAHTFDTFICFPNQRKSIRPVLHRNLFFIVNLKESKIIGNGLETTVTGTRTYGALTVVL